MVIFYKKWKKYNEIQLTKNKMDLNISKITNHPPSTDMIDEASAQVYRLFRLAKKEGNIQYGYRTMRNSCTSVFPNTRAWEQQERNKIKKLTKMARRDA